MQLPRCKKFKRTTHELRCDLQAFEAPMIYSENGSSWPSEWWLNSNGTPEWTIWGCKRDFLFQRSYTVITIFMLIEFHTSSAPGAAPRRWRLVPPARCHSLHRWTTEWHLTWPRCSTHLSWIFTKNMTGHLIKVYYRHKLIFVLFCSLLFSSLFSSVGKTLILSIPFNSMGISSPW